MLFSFKKKRRKEKTFFNLKGDACQSVHENKAEKKR
jgi:hypothetical protein